MLELCRLGTNLVRFDPNQPVRHGSGIPVSNPTNQFYHNFLVIFSYIITKHRKIIKITYTIINTDLHPNVLVSIHLHSSYDHFCLMFYPLMLRYHINCPTPDLRLQVKDHGNRHILMENSSQIFKAFQTRCQCIIKELI